MSTERDEQIAEARRVYTAAGADLHTAVNVSYDAARDAVWATYVATLDRIDKEYPA